jgi:hypothetical protein
MRKFFTRLLPLLLALETPIAWAAAPVSAPTPAPPATGESAAGHAGPAGTAVALSATPLPAANDLGQGLTYVLPAAIAKGAPVLPPGSLVLDLREPKFSTGESAAWLAALRARTAGQQVCLVLISPATPAPLLAALAAGMRGCVSVGRAAPGYRPDNAVETDAASDGQASAALVGGTRPADLLIENATKVRHDEVELAKAHAAGKAPPDEGDDLKPDASVAATPIDRVLQRAVQLHRGLLALGKLPKV